jgi:hypothetical protein
MGLLGMSTNVIKILIFLVPYTRNQENTSYILVGKRWGQKKHRPTLSNRESNDLISKN